MNATTAMRLSAHTSGFLVSRETVQADECDQPGDAHAYATDQCPIFSSAFLAREATHSAGTACENGVAAMKAIYQPLWRWLLAMIVVCIQLCFPVLAADFPVRVSGDGTYLEDASGRPFLLMGDAAWSLIGELSREEADEYLADRQRRGFNTILVSLIEHRFSRNAPNNFYHKPPFKPGGNFSRPNDAYFDDVDWVLHKARERGILVLLCPSYLGVDGGAEGWLKTMVTAGSDALYAYGRYLGERYRDFDNIIWVQGGDHNPVDKQPVEALARGIAEADPSSLQTVHGSPNTIGSTYWGDAAWLNLDTLYTYEDVATEALKRYRDGPAIPFILIESAYEGERGTNEQTLRQIAYGALLSGASGQVFGNNPVWHFSGPGLYEQPLTWRAALGSRGAMSMTHLKRLFDGLEWWRLRPDQGVFLKMPRAGTAIAARTVAGDIALVYLSETKDVIINPKHLSANQVRWYDPSSGRWSETSGRPYGRTLLKFTTPRPLNDAGFSDWVLVFTNAAAGTSLRGPATR